MQNKSPDNRYVVIRRIYVLNIPPQNLSLMFIKLKRELEKFFFPSSVDVALSRAQQPRNAPLLDNRMLSERRRGKTCTEFSTVASQSKLHHFLFSREKATEEVCCGLVTVEKLTFL